MVWFKVLIHYNHIIPGAVIIHQWLNACLPKLTLEIGHEWLVAFYIKLWMQLLTRTLFHVYIYTLLAKDNKPICYWSVRCITLNTIQERLWWCLSTLYPPGWLVTHKSSRCRIPICKRNIQPHHVSRSVALTVVFTAIFAVVFLKHFLQREH